MATDAAGRTTRVAGLALLWFGVLGGAVAWTVRLVGSYMLMALGCDMGLVGPEVLGITVLEMMVVALTLGMAGASALAAYVSWRIWRRTRAGAWDQRGGPPGRSGFLALAGVLLSGLFVLVILMEGSSIFFIGVCDR